MKDAKVSSLRISVRIGRGLRDAWLIVGVTIAFLLLVEIVYRGQALVRWQLSRPDRSVVIEGPRNPFDTSAWASYYRADHEREELVRWEPYVYLRNPSFRGHVISVDSLGNRVTPLPPSRGYRPVRIFFLGGSTTFGWFQRNEHTIPAEATRLLQEALGDPSRVDPTNFGVPGRIFTQEVLKLILELRAGSRPDIVVFYNGINDVMATVQDGRAGVPQNETNRVEDFERGRALASETNAGVGGDLQAAKTSLQAILARFRLVQRVKRMKHPEPDALISIDSAAAGIVHMYTENARLVEALASKYGFIPIYVWQAALLSSRKKLTAREKVLIAPAEADPQIRRIRDIHRAVPNLIGTAMYPIAGNRFIDDTSLFDGDSLDIYVDIFGHTYESANPRIVETFMPRLLDAAKAVAR